MPNNTSRLLKWSAAGIFSAVFMWACDNDPATIGLDTLPATDVLNANSVSTAFYGVQVMPEKLVSDHLSVPQPRIPLGELNDPLSGYTKADFVTQINLGPQRPVFRYDEDTETIDENKFFPDSLVLNLSYRYLEWYGNPSAEQTIQVYELTEDLQAVTSEQRYYNNFNLEGKIGAELLGETSFSPRGGMHDSIWEENNYRHKISIPLSEELLHRLFNLSEEALQSRDVFQQVLKGLYVTVKPELGSNATGALVRIDLQDTASNLTLHYRKELREAAEEGEEGELLQVSPKTYRFPINKEVVFFGRFEHQPLADYRNEDASVEHLLIQGMAGPQARVDLTPFILQWSDSLAQTGNVRYGISGVDLVFTADTTNVPNLFFPYGQALDIVHLNERGNPVIASDAYIQDDDTLHIQAFLNKTAIYNEASNSFTFRMNQDYFEKAALGEITPSPFYLVLPSMQFAFNRIRLYHQHPKWHPVIKVKYVNFHTNE